MEKTEGKKTVIVIDENGKEYEKTYPKRAKGLVKNGRARYINENTIMLIACPSNDYILEDNKMNNNELNNKTLDLNYIMDKIDSILESNKQIMGTISEVDDGTVFENIHHPINKVIETNNNLIEFLKEISSSILSNERKNKETIIEALSSNLEVAITSGASEDLIKELIFQIKN